MTLTSKYSWLYNQYPFTNDPNAGLLHPDWWITECGCVPAATKPDPDGHQAVPAHATSTTSSGCCLARRYRAGDEVRLTAPAGTPPPGRSSTCSTRELVGRPHVNLLAANVLLFGADPTGRRDSRRRVRQGDRFRQEASS